MEVTESEGTLPQLPWGCRAISSLRKAQDEGLEAQGADKTLPFQTAKGWLDSSDLPRRGSALLAHLWNTLAFLPWDTSSRSEGSQPCEASLSGSRQFHRDWLPCASPPPGR